MEQNYSRYLRKYRNKVMHSIHGNRVKTFGLKLYHFNKGNSHFRNKIDQLQVEIQKYKPDVISLSEANIYKNDTLYINQFPDFDFVFDQYWDTLGWSRQIIMIKKTLTLSAEMI